MGSRTRYAGKRVRGSSRHTTTIESLNMVAMVDRTHTPHSHTTQAVVNVEQWERDYRYCTRERGAFYCTLYAVELGAPWLIGD